MWDQSDNPGNKNVHFYIDPDRFIDPRMDSMRCKIRRIRYLESTYDEQRLYSEFFEFLRDFG